MSWNKCDSLPAPTNRRILGYIEEYDAQVVVQWEDGWDGEHWYENDEHFHKHIDYWQELPLSPLDSYSNETFLARAASKLMRDRNETVELFCKTFLALHFDGKEITPAALLDLYNLVELECTLGENLAQTFRLKMRENGKAN